MNPESQDMFSSDWAQKIRDEEHLRILALLFRIEAALHVVLGLLSLCLGLFGLTLALSGLAASAGGGVIYWMGWGLSLLGGLAFLATWVQAALDFSVSKALTARHSRKFCLVVAVSECLFVPFGTLLAISTLVVLTRPSVLPLFDDA